MPFYAASARLLQPVTAMGACTAWDATSACCVPSSAGRDGGDVPMLREVISRTKERFPVDASRIYVVGIANGGFLAARLACEMPQLFAGILVYAAGFDAAQCTSSQNARVPLLLMHGDEDELVPESDSRSIAEAHGSAELHIIPGGGHRLRHDPRAIAMLIGWLDRQR